MRWRFSSRKSSHLNHGLSSECLYLMKEFLPSFQYPEGATEQHRKVACQHWEVLFQESSQSKKRRDNRICAMNSESEKEADDQVHSIPRKSRGSRYAYINAADRMQPTERLSCLYDTFYNYLELNAPELKTVFKSNKSVRNTILQHIIRGLRTLIAQSINPERIKNLTKTHIHYGVKMEYFDLLGLAVIYSMRQCSGNSWSLEIEEAWRRLYAHCSVILLKEQQELLRQRERQSDGDITKKQECFAVKICNQLFKTKTSRKRTSKLSKAHLKLVDMYLPNFRYAETSTDHHRHVAANHWANVFKDISSSRSGSMSSQSTARGSEDGTVESPEQKLRRFYDTFYEYLERNAPELQPLFRNSIHVRSRVLVHISKEMRVLLTSPNLTQRVSALTSTHIKANVKLEHFDTLGQALIHSMRAVSGDFWSQEIENAWKRLYAHCSVILLHEQQRVLKL